MVLLKLAQEYDGGGQTEGGSCVRDRDPQPLRLIDYNGDQCWWEISMGPEDNAPERLTRCRVHKGVRDGRKLREWNAVAE